MAAAAAGNNNNNKGAARKEKENKQKQSLVSRTLERCRTGLRGGGRASMAAVAPAGCFSVYVGPERERFVVRADRASHPRFRRLLDDAESEYGYSAHGPLALPSCAVEDFLDVLWHMDHDAEIDDGEIDGLSLKSPVCGAGGLQRARSGYRALSTARSSPASFFFSPSCRRANSPAARGRRSSGS